MNIYTRVSVSTVVLCNNANALFSSIKYHGRSLVFYSWSLSNWFSTSTSSSDFTSTESSDKLKRARDLFHASLCIEAQRALFLTTSLTFFQRNWVRAFFSSLLSFENGFCLSYFATLNMRLKKVFGTGTSSRYACSISLMADSSTESASA